MKLNKKFFTVKSYKCNISSMKDIRTKVKVEIVDFLVHKLTTCTQFICSYIVQKYGFLLNDVIYLITRDLTSCYELYCFALIQVKIYCTSPPNKKNGAFGGLFLHAR